MDLSSFAPSGLAVSTTFAAARITRRSGRGLKRFGALFALWIGVSVAHATDRWVPESWFVPPTFEQTVVADRVTAGPDGKLYASFFNGGAIDGTRDAGQLGALIRLHDDGTVDDTFSIGPVLTDVWAVAFQSDGRILAGGLAGNETEQTGFPLYRVFRFNTDGSLDTTFQSPVFRGIPRFIHVLGNDTMLVVPSNGNSGNGGIAILARLTANGALDGTFSQPDLAGGFIFAPPAVDAVTGDIYIGGVFSSVNGQARPAVARLNADGTLDTDFVPAGFTLNGFSPQVRGIGLQTQGANAGKVIVAGGEILVPGSADPSANRPLIRLDANGALDTTFSLTTQVAAGMNPRPRLLEVLVDDTIVIVGSAVARFGADGVQLASETYARPSFSQEFFWMEAFDNGSVIVAPQLGSMANGQYASSLVKFTPAGAVDDTFTAPDFTRRVYPSEFYTYADGRFLVWGNFDTANGQARPGLARFNNGGGLDTSFANPPISSPAYVTSAAVANDGRILATVFDPVSFGSSVLKLNSNGTVDGSFALDPDLGEDLGGIDAHLYGDGSVLLAGLNAQRLADDSVLLERLDPNGAIDDLFDASGLTVPGAVYRNPNDTIDTMTIGHFDVLAEDSQGRLVVRTSVGPYTPRPSSLGATLLRLNPDGSLDAGFTAPLIAWPTSTGFPIIFNSATGFQEQVEATYSGSPFQGAVVQPDGRILVYGLFTEIDGQSRAGIARLNSNGSLDLTFDPGTGAAFTAVPDRIAQVTGVHLGAGNRIWVAGYFDSFNGQAASGLIQLDANGAPITGFEASVDVVPYTGGNMTVQDLEWDDRVLVGGTYTAGPTGSFPAAFQRLVQVPLVQVYAQPQDLTLVEGVPGALRIAFTDPQAEVTLQWYRNGEAIDGATGAELALDGSLSSAGSYQVAITGGGETLWSRPASVQLGDPTGTWLTDTGFTAPEFLVDRMTGRVTLDPIGGGYYGSFVNGSYVSGADGVTTGPVVRVSSTGVVDATFNTGDVLNEAWAVLPLGDGSVLVGGVASTESGLSGQKLYRVFKFSATGVLDPNFHSPVFGGSPRFMTLQSDGRIIVVPSGNNGANGGIRWIARLEADGSLDENFHQVWLNEVIFAPPVVDSVTGKIYIGGSFWEVDGTPRPAVARLNADGTLDTDWVPTGFNPDSEPQQVRGLALQTQGANAGKLLVAGGGLFPPDGAGGTKHSAVIRLNTDGSLDSGFTTLTHAEAGMSVRPRLLHLLAEDKFLILGPTVTRFLADGAVDTDYNAPELNQEAYWFAVHSDGSVVLPPEPGTVLSTNPDSTDDDLEIWRWVRFGTNGAHDTGFSGPQFELITFPPRFALLADGDILTWGGFSKADGSYLPGLIRLNADGSVDGGFSTPGIAQPDSVVFAEPIPGGGILATTSNAVTGARNTLKLTDTGAIDATFTVDAAIGTEGLETKVLANGSVLVWSASPQRIVDDNAGFGRLSSLGVLDQNFGGEGDQPALGAVYRNGDSFIDSVTVGNFRVLAVDSQGRILARTTIGGYPQNAGYLQHTIRRYLSDGTIDPDFNAPILWWSTFLSFPTVTDAQTNGGGPGQVRASIAYTPFSGALAQPDGKVIIYGSFQNIGGHSRPGIARLNLNGTLDLSFNPGTGAAFLGAPGRNGSVSSVTDAGNGQLWVTGFFDSFDQHARPGLVLLNSDGSVDDDFATDLSFIPYFTSGALAELAADGSLIVAGTYEAAGGDVQSFHRLVRAATPPLAFIDQPAPFTAAPAGLDVTLEVEISGVGVTYQWRKDGVDLEGAVGSSLTLSAADAADSGWYDVVITDAGDTTLTSQPARVVIGPAVDDTAPQLAWRNPLPAGGSLYSVIHDGARFVATGTGARILESSDGVTWTQTAVLPEEQMNGLAHLAATYVAVGGGGAIYTSTDRSSWTLAARDPNYRWLWDVTFASGRFVAVGDSGVAYVSTTGGDSWTEASTGTGASLRAVAGTFNAFVAIGGNGLIVRSTDGFTWSQVSPPSGFESAQFNAVKYLNDQFVIVGGSGAFLTSPDGLTWTAQNLDAGHWLVNLTRDGEAWLALAGDGHVLRSTDLAGWTRLGTSSGGPMASLNDAVSAGGVTVSVGSGGVIRRSTDAGLTWQDTGSLGGIYGFNDVEWIDDGFVAAGSNGTAMVSDDGRVWHSLNTGTGHWLNAVAAGAGRYVFASGWGVMMVTEDGVAWQEIAVGDNFENRDLVFDDGTFYAVGAAGRLRQSTDGLNWNTMQIPGVDRTLQSIAFGADAAVIVGDNGLILRSTDGEVWSDHSIQNGWNLRRVRWLDGLFVAVGDNRTVLLSTDGITWNPAPVPNDYVNFGFGYADVRKGGDAYYVVSTQGRVLRTTNWLSWTQAAAIEAKPNLNALAFGAGRMIVAGEGGAILSTTNPTVPTGPSFPNGALPPQVAFASGGFVSLGAFASGEGELSFAWTKDGQPIEGATTPFLRLFGATAEDAGTYTVTVTGHGGATITSTTQLVVAGLPEGNGPIYGVSELPGGDRLSEVRAATLVDGVIHAVGTSIARSAPDTGSVGDANLYWRSDTGLIAVPELSPTAAGFNFITAAAITPDAVHVAARSRTEFFGQRVATRLTTADGSVARLPDAPSFDGYSAAVAISDDGNLLAGFAFTASQTFNSFVADVTNSTVTEFGAVLPDYENLFPAGNGGMSADGSVVVGSQEDADLQLPRRAFRWTSANGVETLPLLSGGTWSSAAAVSADGTTTLLRGDSTAFPNGELFLHHAGDNSVEPLGSPDAGKYPLNLFGMSGDASVIVVSFFDVGTSDGATYLRNQHGWFSLQEAILGLGTGLDGWNFDGGLGVSRDGRLVFGQGFRNGFPEGFVVEFPAGYLAAFEPPPPLDGPHDDSIVGAWSTGANAEFVIVLTADGSYVHIELVPGGNPDATSGFEHGRYAWSADGTFRVSTVVDFNGDVGLGDLTGRSDVTVAVDGDQLTLTIPGDDAVTLQRVADSSQPLVGAWDLESDGEVESDGGAILVLMSDGKFFFAEEDEADGEGQSGIEHGAWTWNSETGAFNASGFTVDTNGTWGLSHPDGQVTVNLQHYGWILAYADAVSGGTFERIAPQPVDITTNPTGGDFTAGGEVVLSVEVSGTGPFTYQWRRNGVALEGETGSTLTLSPLTEDDEGYYDVAVTGPDGTSVSDEAFIAVGAAPTPPGRALLQQSVRLVLGVGERAALPFRIEGSGDKQVLVRAVGPHLANFDIDTAHSDPRLRVVDELGFEIATNDDWDADDGSTVSTVSGTVGAFSLAAGSADAATVALLPPGSYTLLIEGDGTNSGMLFAEIYDADGPATTSRLVYLGAAARASAQSIVQSGFVVQSDSATDLLVRVLGPSLGLTGVAADPQLTVKQAGSPIFSNENWGGATDLATAFGEARATSLDPGSLDAAAIHAFATGAYSLETGNDAGLHLTEIFDRRVRAPITEPVLLIPPRSVVVAEGGTARFEVYATSSSTLSYQWLKGGNAIDGETSPVLEITNVSAADADNYALRLTNADTTVDSAPVTLALLAAPTITTQPGDVAIQSGGTATLEVGVSSGAGPVSYQWYAGNSGDTASPISGATQASYTTPSLTATASYWVRVTNTVGSVDSATATVSVFPPSDVVATHSVVGAGYQPGGTVTISTTVTYSGPVSTYGWSVVLPSGWSYASTGGEGAPSLRPEAGSTGTLGWGYTGIPPASPVTFTYTLNVPAGTSGPAQLTASVLFRDGSQPQQTFTATPSPLTIEQAPPFHSADTDGDSALSLTELLRVIELYNTRNGTVRTGAYRVLNGTEDGFSSDATVTGGQTVTLARYHSGDSNQDGRLDLTELLRVIELYNYRSGTVRTGAYHPATGTEDGFASGPAPQS